MKLNTFDSILNKFLNEYIETSKEHTITWKNMLFLWKNFLDSNSLPQIIFTNNLKKEMIEKFNNYDETTNQFMNYTSKHIPSIARFLSFWENHMVINDDENKLEISEIKHIIKKHLNSNYDEETIINLITHYFSDVAIEQNKYINGYSCLLWDKVKNIEEHF